MWQCPGSLELLQPLQCPEPQPANAEIQIPDQMGLLNTTFPGEAAKWLPCNHGTWVILNRTQGRMPKNCWFFPNPVQLLWISSYYISLSAHSVCPYKAGIRAPCGCNVLSFNQKLSKFQLSFIKPETTESFQSFTDISHKKCIYLQLQLVPTSDNSSLEKKIIIYFLSSIMWGATVQDSVVKAFHDGSCCTYTDLMDKWKKKEPDMIKLNCSNQYGKRIVLTVDSICYRIFFISENYSKKR